MVDEPAHTSPPAAALASFAARLGRTHITRAMKEFAGLLRRMEMWDEAGKWDVWREICVHMPGPGHPIFEDPSYARATVSLTATPQERKRFKAHAALASWGEVLDEVRFKDRDPLPSRAVYERLYDRVVKRVSRGRAVTVEGFGKLSEDMILGGVLESLSGQVLAEWRMSMGRWRRMTRPSRTDVDSLMRNVRSELLRRLLLHIIKKRGWAVVCADPGCLCLTLETRRGCRGYIYSDPRNKDGLRVSLGIVSKGAGWPSKGAHLRRFCCDRCQQRVDERRKRRGGRRSSQWIEGQGEEPPAFIYIRKADQAWDIGRFYRMWEKLTETFLVG